MVGPGDSFIAWDQPNLEDLMENLYCAVAEEEQYYKDCEAWSEIERPQGWLDKKDTLNERLRDCSITDEEFAVAEEENDAEFGVPSSPTQPRGACCDLKEFGFDWNRPGAYMCTETNGTHAKFFTVRKDDEVWMDPSATAQKILEFTCAFPGWRHIYCEGGHEKITFRLHGGWRD